MKGQLVRERQGERIGEWLTEGWLTGSVRACQVLLFAHARGRGLSRRGWKRVEAGDSGGSGRSSHMGLATH